MSNNSLFPFLAGAAIGAAAMWLAKSDREQVNAILDKIESNIFKGDTESGKVADGDAE